MYINIDQINLCGISIYLFYVLSACLFCFFPFGRKGKWLHRIDRTDRIDRIDKTDRIDRIGRIHRRDGEIEIKEKEIGSESGDSDMVIKIKNEKEKRIEKKKGILPSSIFVEYIYIERDGYR